MGGMTNPYRLLVGESEGTDHLGDADVDVRIILKCVITG
jgi:hypothetical protein